MRCSPLLLVGEFTRTLYSLVPSPTATAVTTLRRNGKMVEWDPFERNGVIEDAEGVRYHVANTRAFETVLPTMLRTLEGAAVEFDVDEAPAADRVIIRSRLTPITSDSYKQKPPVDFLSPQMLGFLQPKSRRQVVDAPSSEKDRALPVRASTESSKEAPSKKASGLYAKNITVHVASIPAKQIARWSGPLSAEEVIMPTKNLKDMRSSRIFDRETNTYLALKQRLGSAEAATRLMADQQAHRDSSAVVRTVITESAQGVVLAWSGIHRSGVIREVNGTDNVGSHNSVVTTEGSVEKEKMCIVRNVWAFRSALPTSQSLLQKRVTFTKVAYSTQPQRFFAEDIEVTGEVKYDAAVPSLEEAQAAKVRARADALHPRGPGAMILEEEEDIVVTAKITARAVGEVQETNAVDPKSTAKSAQAVVEESSSSNSGIGAAAAPEEVDPDKVFYGVVVRWSGGQGVVEGGDGRHYYLRSAADFLQLVDQDAYQLRGAVVQFKRDPAHPRYACEVDILSTATTTMSEVKPLLERTQFRDFVKGGSKVAARAQQATADEAPEKEELQWIHGTLLSWSALEGQGIVLSDADAEARYVLRDAEENVLDYAANQQLLKKGRRVRFTIYGSTGRLACNLELLDTEMEEEALRDAELRPKEPSLSLDGNMNEAIPSPMSTSYWLNRMDKAGYDTKEVKELQNRALTLDEDEDDDGTEKGKFLDSDELLKKDPWWSDPRKNIRFPNSDMTAGHLALIGPASMMNVAMKTKDPKKMEKMLKKYQSRLTEDQKEYAWKQAKEMAPKYDECVRKGREQNEEPSFYFF